jgi:hypothetical protein
MLKKLTEVISASACNSAIEKYFCCQMGYKTKYSFHVTDVAANN